MWRSDDRFDERLSVDFLVSVVGKDGHRMCQARNLSSGGVQLERNPDTLQPGHDVEIGLRLPELPGPIGCSGTVVYARGTVAGLSFTEVPAVGQVLIDAFLAAERSRRRTDASRPVRGSTRRSVRRAHRSASGARRKERHLPAPLR